MNSASFRVYEMNNNRLAFLVDVDNDTFAGIYSADEAHILRQTIKNIHESALRIHARRRVPVLEAIKCILEYDGKQIIC